MKRPWRRVVKVEDYYHELAQHETRGKPRDKHLVPMRKLHLECGHYVTEKKVGHAPCKAKCHTCQHSGVGKFDLPRRVERPTRIFVSHEAIGG